MQRLGFIHDMMDVKVLILYVMSRVNYPVTVQQIYELCYQDECLSYFDVCTAVPELVKNAHQDIGGKAQQDLGERKDDQERQHRKTKSQQQDRNIQFIRAVAAFHEAAELFPHMPSSNFS